MSAFQMFFVVSRSCQDHLCFVFAVIAILYCAFVIAYTINIAFINLEW